MVEKLISSLFFGGAGGRGVSLSGVGVVVQRLDAEHVEINDDLCNSFLNGNTASCILINNGSVRPTDERQHGNILHTLVEY